MNADQSESPAARGCKSQHRLFQRWSSMHARCYNPKIATYRYYGGKNPPISVAPEWHDFWVFVDDMFPTFKEGLTVERKDNALGYSRSNCIWATRAEQVKNRSMTLAITHNGKTMNGTEWAKTVGMNPDVFRVRMKQLGWSIERALSTPVKRQVTRTRS